MVAPTVRIAVFDLELAGECPEQAFGDRGSGVRLLAAADDQHEFVAADAGEKSALGGGLQTAGDLAQERVTERVTIAVVGVLEAVEIERQHGELLARLLRLIERRLHGVVEGEPVRQVGQVVEMRHAGDALLGAFALGDVLQHREQILRLVVVVAHRDVSGGRNSHAVAGRVNFVVGDHNRMFRSQRRVVLRDDVVGLVLRINVA